jgi:hypothetical protein
MFDIVCLHNQYPAGINGYLLISKKRKLISVTSFQGMLVIPDEAIVTSSKKKDHNGIVGLQTITIPAKTIYIFILWVCSLLVWTYEIFGPLVIFLSTFSGDVLVSTIKVHQATSILGSQILT